MEKIAEEKIIFKIIKYQIQNVLRSRWIIIYTIGLFLVTILVIKFSSDSSKIVLSLMTLLLILNPLIGVLFGSIYIYNSREFIELVLAQPIKRSDIFAGIFIGIAIPFIFATWFGVLFPVLIYPWIEIPFLLFLLWNGTLIQLIFLSVSMLVTSYFDDKSTGLGIAFVIWLFACWIYDGMVLLLAYVLQDYPLETPFILVSMMNPVDLARISIILRMNVAALMGVTGAVFQKFFGQFFGAGFAYTLLVLWGIIPLIIAYKKFKTKDF